MLQAFDYTALWRMKHFPGDTFLHGTYTAREQTDGLPTSVEVLDIAERMHALIGDNGALGELVDAFLRVVDNEPDVVARCFPPDHKVCCTPAPPSFIFPALFDQFCSAVFC
jgi:hypothetical protein